MFDKERLHEILVKYKKDFAPDHWEDEKYKWEAVKIFQDHWDVNAADFPKMLEDSLSGTYNLLSSQNNFPRKMICSLAKNTPEVVRGMFIALFDESKDVYERIESFRSQADELIQKYKDGTLQHYQREGAITTYLWLRFPDKYYIFKYGTVKNTAEELNGNYTFKKGAHADNIRNHLLFYNEISEELKKDSELVEMLQSQITGDCYPDPELKILTIDVGFYISRQIVKKKNETVLDQADLSNGEIYSNQNRLFYHVATVGDGKTHAAMCSIYSLIYTEVNFLSEVYMTKERYDHLCGILENKKNIILQGAPGVGKTFAATRLAYSMMGVADNDRVAFIQFHQNYSYEDFMMGYKPDGEGFKLKKGIFYDFCQRAKDNPEQDYFFIIDEINRGNMSKIFGELLMLIEKDYRGKTITLGYNGEPFAVPENIYIIGMMNTADRSLAMIDYALRRRFSFFEMEPGFDSEGFSEYQKGLNNEILDDLILKVKELNEEITKDKSLGKGFCIGHSYFCGKETCTEEWLHAVIDYDILPMLSEYWFDDEDKLTKWENILHGVFQ